MNETFRAEGTVGKDLELQQDHAVCISKDLNASQDNRGLEFLKNIVY